MNFTYFRQNGQRVWFSIISTKFARFTLSGQSYACYQRRERSLKIHHQTAQLRTARQSNQSWRPFHSTPLCQAKPSQQEHVEGRCKYIMSRACQCRLNSFTDLFTTHDSAIILKCFKCWQKSVKINRNPLGIILHRCV